GSRYVGKVYNDQWMMERGFLEVKTFKDIISSRGVKRVITITPENPVSEAAELMQKYNIENLPVWKDGEIVGSVSESGLFNKVMQIGQDIKNNIVESILEKPYPVIDLNTSLEKISSLINKENGAVIAI